MAQLLAWRSDPDGTAATLRILARVPGYGTAPGSAPVAASAPSYAASQTASGLDVSALPTRLRSVAAGIPDRATVWRLIERFSGPEEPDPAVLELEGFDDVAAGVSAAIGEESTVRQAALNDEIEAANLAHVHRMAAEQDARREAALEARRLSRERQ